MDSSRKMVTIRRYNDATQAHLAKSLLEDQGIDAFVTDDEINRLHPFLSSAVGGVRLMVAESSLAKAEKILNGDGGTTPDQNTSVATQRTCLQCSSSNLHNDTSHRKLAIKIIAIVTAMTAYLSKNFATSLGVAFTAAVMCLPLIRLRYRCRDCGYQEN